MPRFSFFSNKKSQRQRAHLDRCATSHKPFISKPSNFQHIVHITGSKIDGPKQTLKLTPMSDHKISAMVTSDRISKPTNFRHLVDGRQLLQKLCHATKPQIRRMTHPERRQTRLTAKDISLPSHFVHVFRFRPNDGEVPQSTIPCKTSAIFAASSANMIFGRSVI
ncbi:uncharacterized protein LOC111265249 [Varroa jacobsoni]|uniref:CRIB domain-containing protein n=1 Tax=Varroa destructor TaxID=109461 RepID=A0A7M7J6B1_VARDE|nr:uncharacterized protein LOC111244499 [Varroa destructor]XP_022697488.1 uncharacterized protein LOC111265249 [Varroa jacobsoni]